MYHLLNKTVFLKSSLLPLKATRPTTEVVPVRQCCCFLTTNLAALLPFIFLDLLLYSFLSLSTLFLPLLEMSTPACVYLLHLPG